MCEASAPDARPFLEVSNLTLQYKTARYLVTATSNIGFHADSFDRLILLGPSGCGKSTILKAVGGYIKPAGGEIRLQGKLVTKPGADRGMVFQEFDQLLPWKTALENIVFAVTSAGRLPRRQAVAEAREWLHKVNLTAFENSYPHELSGGMKQRVAIARCLALRSPVILMDEPFASLDAFSRSAMQEELLSLWEENRRTLIFVTHSIEEALILGTRIILFSSHPGQVRAEFTPVRRDTAQGLRGKEVRERIEHLLFQDRVDYAI
ncbi:MAG: ABC transporter ATP-binding protein [Desulfovibrio sp.]|jgi:NitT/TauT family transport system ATP-binding protein|nr:ABC transporter ATP-binding protein [Desulfovibrio sp.]